MKKVPTEKKRKAFKILQASNAIASLRLEGYVVRVNKGRATITKEPHPDRLHTANAG